MISRELMMAAINDIAAINKIEMDPKHLALDVYALAQVFSYEEEFKEVIVSIIMAIKDVFKDGDIGDDLKYRLKGFKSYHFSSPYPEKPSEEDMRVVYPAYKNTIILAFGHRYIPFDFYQRLINMRTMTIQSVMKLAQETQAFADIAVRAYNDKFNEQGKRLNKNGTRRPRIKEEQEALDGFFFK